MALRSRGSEKRAVSDDGVVEVRVAFALFILSFRDVYVVFVFGSIVKML